MGNLLVAGLGPLSQQRVRVGGLYGGGLCCVTVDGWKIERHPLSWPDEELFLSPPGHSLLWSPPGQPLLATKLSGFSSEIRAFGFSPTGRSLVMATAADICVFAR